MRPDASVAVARIPVSSPFTLGTKAFRKVSPPVTGLSASSGAGTEISFSWDDYLATNLATAWMGETGTQSARGYHIQVDTEPSFQAPLLDDQVVDQTTYTAWDRLYPEGTLYWRVQAIDSEANGLSWSAVQSLTKESPAVQLQSPANGATAAGTVPLRWAPQAFAASYTVEVYKNNDRSFSTVNRLFTATVKTPAYAWTQPIPADPTAYVWRVRRTDAEGNPGPWSTPFEFRSLGAAPVLTSPANGSWQPGAGTLFTWTDVPGAATYSLVATSSSGSRLASVTTPGNAYATTRALATGSYTWSVTALDSAGKSLGSSLTGSFRVDGDGTDAQDHEAERTGHAEVGLRRHLQREGQGRQQEDHAPVPEGQEEAPQGEGGHHQGRPQGDPQAGEQAEARQDLPHQAHRHPDQGRGRQPAGEAQEVERHRQVVRDAARGHGGG